MKVHLELRLLPMLCRAVGNEELEFEFDGGTITELIQALMQKFGRKAEEALTTKQAEFDTMIQIALNRKIWITADKHDTPLHEGDTLTFMLLIGGG